MYTNNVAVYKPFSAEKAPPVGSYTVTSTLGGGPAMKFDKSIGRFPLTGEYTSGEHFSVAVDKSETRANFD